MLRSLTLFCVAAVVAVSIAFAQDKSGTDNIKATPEILALFSESFESLAREEPRDRAEGYLKLLGYGLLFEDTTHAKKVAENLLGLIPALEPEGLRYQFCEAAAHVLCELKEFPQAVEALNRILTADDRYHRQQSLAVKIIVAQESDETVKPFDTSELLRQAISGALEAQDRSSEAVSLAFLGRELARQGKMEAAKAAFTEAFGIAQKLDNTIEQGYTMGIILKSQAWYEQVDDALAALQAVTNPEAKLLVSYALAEALIYHEKYDEAETLLKTLSADQVRDSFLLNLVLGREKDITDEKIGELASLVSSEEQRTSFLREAVVQLRRESRDDVAQQVARRFADPAEAKTALFSGGIRRLLDEGKFAEAVQTIDLSDEDAELLQAIKRSVLALQYSETPDDSVAQQFSETFSSVEKVLAAELKESAQEAVEIADPDARMDALLEVFQEQTQLMDIAGQKQTLKLISEQLDKETDTVRLIQYRLLLARLQAELQEKNATRENLGKLMQTLSGVKDIQELKTLVPEEEFADESSLQHQLFQVYAVIADFLAKADAAAESKPAFEKAKELAKAESDAVLKSEKLLLLAQLLAE